MSPLRHGAPWASRLSPPVTILTAFVVLALAASVVTWSAPRASAADYLLMPRAELLSRPVSGSAWTTLRSVADAGLGSANLCDQDDDHHLRTLAAALVYARLGDESYGAKARAGVMAAIPTQRVGCGNATLALGRQLMAYVLAADLAGLSGGDDSTFRAFLTTIRGKTIGGHSVWDSLIGTHEDAPNNWGAYAGASRIAASLYLNDAADVARAAAVTRGFLGDRSAYAGFRTSLDSADLSWTCTGSSSTYTPVSAACTRSGVNLDGAVAADISRGGAIPKWPPSSTGIQYQLDSIQGLGLQVELLYRNGFGSAWGWSDSALRRMADVVTRSKAAGGTGWNGTNTARQMPWLLNKRYGIGVPTSATSMGRAIGFTDWLYGAAGSAGATPDPTPRSTSAPTPDPTPKPTPKPTSTPAGPPPPGDAPVTGGGRVRLSTTSGVPGSGVPVYVNWALHSSDDPVGRYQLQLRAGDGPWVSKRLSSATARSYRTVLASGVEYTFRVRAIDRLGRVGDWSEFQTVQPRLVSDASSGVDWSGGWAKVGSASYLGGAVHSTNTSGRTSTLDFSGSSVAWVGPVGSTRGKAYVYVDGTRVAVVDLYRSRYEPRRVVYAGNLSDGSHTLVVKVLGTRGRPTVAVDSYYVLDLR